MKKALFLGPADKRESVLQHLQKLGVVQIEPYMGDDLPRDNIAIDMTEADKLYSAYKDLQAYEEAWGLKDEPCPEGRTPAEIVELLTDLDRELARVREERVVLQNKLEDILPWGNFSLDDIQLLAGKGNLYMQFWEILVKDWDRVKLDGAIEWFQINNDAQRKYILTVAGEKLHLEHCLEERFDEDLTTVQRKLDENAAREREILDQLHCYVSAKNEVYRAWLAELNNINYKQALASAVKPLDGLFALQGWMKADAYSKVESELDGFTVRTIEIAPDEEERVPTTMKNRGIAAMGQDLVEFYDTPAHEDWDPSFWLFLSFTVFFAMIMGDGGYGFLMLLLTVWFRFKARRKKAAIKRFLNMGIILSFATVVYGVMSGSIFGLSQNAPLFGKIVGLQLFNGGCTNPQGGMDKAALTNMMRASILIGMIHISLSLLLKSFRLFSSKQFIQPLSNFAWIVFIWTFFFWYGQPYWGVLSQDPLEVQIMIGCAIVVFLTSAGTLHPLKLIFGGLGGLYNGVQFFADVLSYIRIFALGLSGALIALTFNNMTAGLFDAGIAGKIFAPLVYILGHLLNMALCLMSSVIHGLRLNYLEYYRWSFDGGGRPFNPLRDLLANEK